MSEFTVIEARLVEHITQAAQRMVDAAPSQCTFNGIVLVANVGTTAGDIVAEFHRGFDAMVKAKRESPEGRAQAQRDEERCTQAQRQAEALVAELDAINYDDIDAVVAWFERAVDPLGHRGVVVDRARIVEAFRSHGYEPNVNCGPAFDGNDADNFARYIIGQAMCGIRTVGSPHHLVCMFAAQWRERFPRRTATAP